MQENIDLKGVLEILRFVNKSDLTELNLEDGDFKLHVRRGGEAPQQVTYVTGGEGQAAAPQTLAVPMEAPAKAGASTTGKAAQAEPATAAQEEAAPAPSGNTKTFNSPMIGTFYRSPGPDQPMFVNVGDTVKKGDILCIVEAMKLFNEIEAEFGGKIVKILVDDAQPVEYDQPLFEIEPM